MTLFRKELQISTGLQHPPDFQGGKHGRIQAKKKAGLRDVGSQKRKLKVWNILRFSLQHSHQLIQTQYPLQQGARRDALSKAESNWGFRVFYLFKTVVLQYFSFFLFFYHDFNTPLLKHPKHCVPSHLPIKISPKSPNFALG